MSKSFVFIVLVLAFGAATYFLGRKAGSNNMTTNVVQNVNLVQQIAELAALSVNGSTTVKVSNSNNSAGMWDKFKNYFAENTLQITLPYEAKYGVQLQNKKITIDTKDKIIIVNLPKCKLLSLQLQLDKLEMMNQTGLFATTTIKDLSAAQKQLYEQAFTTLSTNESYLQQAQLQITNILKNYYEPMSYSVQCVFTDEVTAKPKG